MILYTYFTSVLMDTDLFCVPTSNFSVRFLSNEEIVLRNLETHLCVPSYLTLTANNLLLAIRKKSFINSSRPHSLLIHLAFGMGRTRETRALLVNFIIGVLSFSWLFFSSSHFFWWSLFLSRSLSQTLETCLLIILISFAQI